LLAAVSVPVATHPTDKPVRSSVTGQLLPIKKTGNRSKAEFYIINPISIKNQLPYTTFENPAKPKTLFCQQSIDETLLQPQEAKRLLFYCPFVKLWMGEMGACCPVCYMPALVCRS
jgi:hypothetical protein